MDPRTPEARRLLNTWNATRHGWDGFQTGSRRAALRILHATAKEELMPRYEVRTIDADPTTGEVDFHKAPPAPVHYIHDTEKGKPVALTSSHDRNAVERSCAELNGRA